MTVLKLEPLELRLLLADGPVISEFMASNDDTLADEDGDHCDWIELYNPAASPISLEGWYLTDDADELTKWAFPAVTIQPGQYLVVFASDKDRRDVASPLHTNFKLDAGGEYLALVEPDGASIASQFAPEYPDQLEDVSYGLSMIGYELVSENEQAAWHVPGASDAALGDAWTATEFDDSAWSAGPAGLGFGDLGDNFSVTYVKSTVTLSNLSTAESVLADPSRQSATVSASASVINYFNTGTDGHYGSNAAFPGTTTGTDVNDFIILVTGKVLIPAAGQYSFGINSDDGFGLSLSRGEQTFTMQYADVRGPGDTIQTFTLPEAGLYDLRLVYFERGGGAELELFAAPGAYGSFNASAFDLVGDNAAGGLQVGGTVRTDVQTDMLGANASLWTRFEFETEDPSILDALVLAVRYEDGFIAYLNGQEVVRRNAPETAQWNSQAAADRPMAESQVFEEINLNAFLDALQAGTNVLAIHTLNDSPADAQFLIQPALQAASSNDQFRYFTTATPGSANVAGSLGLLNDMTVDVPRGFYETAFQLVLSSPDAGAEIRYTLNGSAPTATTGSVYSAPITISTTTTLRAAAFQPGYEPSRVATHTYLFLQDVVSQPAQPTGFPITWVNLSGGSVAADYEMDPAVTTDPLYASLMIDSLRSLPTLSIVTDQDSLFSQASGIYSNPTLDTVAWERAASVEWINADGTTAFQIDAGLRIQGGPYFRSPSMTNKHSFRLLFKEEYGATKLKYPVFGTDEGVAQEFDTITLRANANDGYSWAPTTYQVQYIRDEFGRQTQLALGQPSPHGNFVHLYINGLYWGLYNPCERPQASFDADYFGGDKDTWDALNSGNAVDGDATAWNAMLALVRQGVTTTEAYQRIQGNNPDGTRSPDYPDYIDIDNYIDYMIMSMYIGDTDWPNKNYYVGRDSDDGDGFKFLGWDLEWSVGINSPVTQNRTTVNTGVAEPLKYLRLNADFCQRFADRVYAAFSPEGPLYVDPSAPAYDPDHPELNVPAACYAALAAQVRLAMIAESARWGDQHYPDAPGTLAHFDTELNNLLTNYFPQRSANVLSQLRASGLYSAIDPAACLLDGTTQNGGTFTPGQTLTFSAPTGQIYYTLDGSDPRLPGGAISPQAILADGNGVELDHSANVKVRAKSGSTWSALNDVLFTSTAAPTLAVSEIHYHPYDPSAAEVAAGYLLDEDFQFVELVNTGPLPVSLETVAFTDGITFDFTGSAVTSLDAGQHVVVVKNRDAFEMRYGAGTLIAGTFEGSLAKNGETIELVYGAGVVFQSFTYNDSGSWPGRADGKGSSLEVVDPA
nr:lamin tail domain-containing protein [Phycisphaerae bacterium]